MNEETRLARGWKVFDAASKKQQAVSKTRPSGASWEIWRTIVTCSGAGLGRDLIDTRVILPVEGAVAPLFEKPNPAESIRATVNQVQVLWPELVKPKPASQPMLQSSPNALFGWFSLLPIVAALAAGAAKSAAQASAEAIQTPMTLPSRTNTTASLS